MDVSQGRLVFFTTMREGNQIANLDMPENRASVWRSIVTDVHFWIPVVVLVAGLVILNWIH